MLNNKLSTTRTYSYHLNGVYGKFGNGVHPISVTLSPEIGNEVVLILIDDTKLIETLSSITPFNFYFKSFAVDTNGGPVGVFVFYVTSDDDDNPLYIYDLAFNPSIESNYNSWLAIAEQTHLHLLLINKFDMTVNLFEFENNFMFKGSVDIIRNITQNKFVYWDVAITEYTTKFTPSTAYLYVI